MSPDRSVTFWCAVVVGTLCALVVAATWLPLGWVVPDAITFTLFILIFPLFGWAVIREASVGGTMTPNHLLRRLPQPTKVVVGAVCAALWLSTMTSVLGSSGQPVTRDGRLYLNNHGELTQVDRETYNEAQNLGSRGFMSVAAVFCVAAAVMSSFGGKGDAEDADGRAT